MVKERLRKLLNFLHIDLTKNLEYDRLTKAILKKHLSSQSNCVDVGAHKGEMVDELMAISKTGHIYAFEPLPHLYERLKRKYANQERIRVLPTALSNKQGQTSFHFVKNAAAYSGIRQRRYAIDNPDIEQIRVEMDLLDNLIPSHEKIDLIKIDVEGGEFDVLKGAEQTILRSNPLIIFECGLGASDFYGTEPDTIFNYLAEVLKKEIYTLRGFIKKEKPLNASEFNRIYRDQSEYYFVSK